MGNRFVETMEHKEAREFAEELCEAIPGGNPPDYEVKRLLNLALRYLGASKLAALQAEELKLLGQERDDARAALEKKNVSAAARLEGVTYERDKLMCELANVRRRVDRLEDGDRAAMLEAKEALPGEVISCPQEAISVLRRERDETRERLAEARGLAREWLDKIDADYAPSDLTDEARDRRSRVAAFLAATEQGESDG